jgi:hypothetical protein
VPGRITTSGAATFGQGLTVGGAGSIGGSLTITGDLVISGTLRSENAITAGGIIQIKTAVSGPNRQSINSAVPLPLSGLSINFTPAVATSRILVQAFVSTNSNYVSAFAIYKNALPTVSTTGYNNLCYPNMQVTYYPGFSPEPNLMHQRTVIHNELAGSTATRTYTVYGISRWSGTSYTLWINNRDANDMPSFSHMIIYEIAQ